MHFTCKTRAARRLVWTHLDSFSVSWWIPSRSLWTWKHPCRDYSPAWRSKAHDTLEKAYLNIGVRVSTWLSCLCSLSPDAAMSPWMCGLHFQSSLLGGGSSLMLALAVLDGLPVLFRDNIRTPFTVCHIRIHPTTIFSDCLTCISSRIRSTAPELFPRRPNARTRLHIPRPFLRQTERRGIRLQTLRFVDDVKWL